MIQLKCSLVTKSGETERDNVDGVVSVGKSRASVSTA
jgi:hypothetical protein